jgi:hypothetical protein
MRKDVIMKNAKKKKKRMKVISPIVKITPFVKMPVENLVLVLC